MLALYSSQQVKIAGLKCRFGAKLNYVDGALGIDIMASFGNNNYKV